MSFRVAGLDPAPFSHLHGMSDADLAAQSVVRHVVRHWHSAPCRIALDDAEIGARVLLLSYEHQPARTPYRQQGPIFVSENAEQFCAENEIPRALARRTLSLRAFDAAGNMVDADVCDGRAAEALIERFFANAEVAYIHAHYARRGCFAARIDRA